MIGVQAPGPHHRARAKNQRVGRIAIEREFVVATPGPLRVTVIQQKGVDRNRGRRQRNETSWTEAIVRRRIPLITKIILYQRAAVAGRVFSESSNHWFSRCPLTICSSVPSLKGTPTGF
jgi:hypothetical protein